MSTSATRQNVAVPFDTDRLDRLMDEAGIDVLLATSKHNAQYLLGGHRAFFFDYMDAMGLSRYLPVVIYPKGAPDKAGYVGHRLERFQQDVRPLWTPTVEASSNGSVDAIEKAVDHIRRAGLKPRRIGVEMEFLPVDSAMKLKGSLPDSEMVSAHGVLQRLRARKRPDELAKLKIASDLVIDSMLAVIASHGPGTTKQELADALNARSQSRPHFQYC